MNLDLIRGNGSIVQECISGSKAYGLDTPTSDTDIKGVFVLPKDQFYGLSHYPQVSDATNDVVFYELARYIELLVANNPSILELAATPQQHILFQHELMKQVKVSDFVSRRCAKTFGGYANSQLKRARGLNKKIVNPVEGPRRHLLEFCYVNHGSGSIRVTDFLDDRKWAHHECGLVKIANMTNIYGLFHPDYRTPESPDGEDTLYMRTSYRGIVSDEDATDVILSSVPKGNEPAALLFFNKEAYSKHCREHKQYQEWVENRNEARYESTMQHGKSYDAKNMMHTFRLLETGIEIAETGEVNPARPNRDFLLSIKNGDFEYDQLVEMADQKLATLEQRFAESNLPTTPDQARAERLLVDIRQQIYDS